MTLFLVDVPLVGKFRVEERSKRSSKRQSGSRTLVNVEESRSPLSCIAADDDHDDGKEEANFP